MHKPRPNSGYLGQSLGQGILNNLLGGFSRASLIKNHGFEESCQSNSKESEFSIWKHPPDILKREVRTSRRGADPESQDTSAPQS